MKTNKHRTQTGIKFLRSLLIVHSTNLWFVGDWYEERHKSYISCSPLAIKETGTMLKKLLYSDETYLKRGAAQIIT